jgi:hypothetical protein
MTEQQRIKKDFEHFKATGDDYPHCQRAHDKSLPEKLLCAAVWCLCAAFCSLCWFLFGGLILEIMK